MNKIRLTALASAATLALALAGCSSGTDATTAPAEGLAIVASTNVYGSIAEKLVGDRGSVTSIIDSAAQDPHSFEAGAQDRLAVSRADLVIANGGGYDSFIDSLVGADADGPDVFTVVDHTGLLEEDADHDHAAESTEDADHDHAAESTEEAGHEGHDHIEGFNEHVWYSLEGMAAASTELVDELVRLDPDGAETYRANLASFSTELDTLKAQAAAIETAHGHRHAVVTELVPVYLIEAAGFHNITPASFTEAIEEGNDVSPAILNETLGLFAGDEVQLLAYNEQTGGAETEQVRTKAEAAKVPVVNFTETLPDGMDYVSWMTDNIKRLGEATA